MFFAASPQASDCDISSQGLWSGSVWDLLVDQDGLPVGPILRELGVANLHSLRRRRDDAPTHVLARRHARRMCDHFSLSKPKQCTFLHLQCTTARDNASARAIGHIVCRAGLLGRRRPRSPRAGVMHCSGRLAGAEGAMGMNAMPLEPRTVRNVIFTDCY